MDVKEDEEWWPACVCCEKTGATTVIKQRLSAQTAMFIVVMHATSSTRKTLIPMNVKVSVLVMNGLRRYLKILRS